jgi:hypothetical protein
METTPKTLDVLMPKTKAVTLSIGAFTVRPLTIRQISALTRTVEGLKPPAADPAQQNSFVFGLIGQLGAKLPDALAILLSNGEPGPELVAKCADLTLDDTALVADAVTEVNDFAKLRATFLAAVAKAFPAASATQAQKTL